MSDRWIFKSKECSCMICKIHNHLSEDFNGSKMIWTIIVPIYGNSKLYKLFLKLVRNLPVTTQFLFKFTTAIFHEAKVYSFTGYNKLINSQ